MGSLRSALCDFIAGCDGFHGVCRPSIEKALTIHERVFPFAWLGILAAAPPSSEELIYCYHERGFRPAQHAHSGDHPPLSPVRSDEDLAQWSDERIWEGVTDARSHSRRAQAHGRRHPAERRDRDLRSFVAEPMQYGKLYLAGDAAHMCLRPAQKGSILPWPTFES